MCILMKVIEGVGSALFLTGGLALAPQYYPKSVGTVTVGIIIMNTIIIEGKWSTFTLYQFAVAYM